MAIYDREFYENRHERTLYSARTILDLVQQDKPQIQSAIDIGCGVGTWLSVLEKRGVAQVQGVDGPWVEMEHLKISPDHFVVADFNAGQIPTLAGPFDLAISLEVAEHISADRADDFVQLLTNLSDYVLFSAAIPGQGGLGHVNEQWPSYWIKLFERRGYFLNDKIRPIIWNDEAIPFWYRQNVMTFSRSRDQHHQPHATLHGMHVVHPELFAASSEPPYVRRAAIELIGAIRRAIKRRTQ